jgi:hypothetical protein
MAQAFEIPAWAGRQWGESAHGARRIYPGTLFGARVPVRPRPKLAGPDFGNMGLYSAGRKIVNFFRIGGLRLCLVNQALLV